MLRNNLRQGPPRIPGPRNPGPAVRPGPRGPAVRPGQRLGINRFFRFPLGFVLFPSLSRTLNSVVIILLLVLFILVLLLTIYNSFFKKKNNSNININLGDNNERDNRRN